MPIIPIILSGGAGARLWPASREARPKQFLELLGRHSTFQETLLRLCDRSVFGKPIVMTNREHRFLVGEQLAAVGIGADIILEPVHRDSGPAIAAGCHYAIRRDGPAAVVLIAAADHLVKDPAAFLEACCLAADAASEGTLVTFGVRPDHPSTSYGYIGLGEPLNGSALRVRTFVEKPDRATAEDYLEQGFLWNSGNIVCRAEALLREYAGFEPVSERAVFESLRRATRDFDWIVLHGPSFEQAGARSIDYAVLEKTRHAAVLPVDFGWSDIGSWDAVWAQSAKDAGRNVVRGPALALDCKDSIIVSNGTFTAAAGIKGLAVVVTEDAVFVGHRQDAPALKELVAAVRNRHPDIIEASARVHCPWGFHQALDSGDRYRVKRITVRPGAKLSLQQHRHRAEHWVVVRGTAQVTVGAMQRAIGENESIYVPRGAIHRLENSGDMDVEIIEVQTGSYLGEDDIVRLEDDYHREAARSPLRARQLAPHEVEEAVARRPKAPAIRKHGKPQAPPVIHRRKAR